MVQETKRFLSYICPHCAQSVIVERDLFSLAAAPAHIKCPCGKSELLVEFKPNRVQLTVPCLFCGREHTVSCSSRAFIRERALAFSCAASGLDCCYVGEEGPVYAATARLEQAVDKLGEDPAINGAFLDEIVMEEIEPKAGEEGRLRVSIDLSDLLGGGDGSAAPSPKVSPASTAKPAASSAVDAEKQRQKEQEAAYRKAVDAMKAAVQKSIETGKETIAKQKAEVQRIAQEKSLAEQRLRQLGLFSFSEKRAVREQIAQFTRESREAEQKLEGLKREARKKAEETLEKHRPPLPPALLGGSKSARRSANGDAAEKAQKIEGVLSILPMTAKEINAALGTTRRCRSPTL